MSPTRKAGLALATAIAVMAVFGAILLVTLDFTGSDALERVWARIVAAARAVSLEARLSSVSNIVLFQTATVPDSELQVETGTSYADARALAEGHATARWCYVKHEVSGSHFTPIIELGHQTGAETPEFVPASNVPAEEARPFSMSADALLALAHQHCRFDG